MKDSQSNTNPLQTFENHYELGNNFFRLCLGETLFYTCALFENNQDSLEQAQYRKVRWHCDQVQALNAHRILDVGCGWGSLLKILVKDYHVKHVTGISVNDSQMSHIRSFENPNIEFQKTYWQNFIPKEPYDIIFCWGAMEHIANQSMNETEKMESYRYFFKKAHEWLKPGGRLSVQAITYGNMLKIDFNKFFATEIVPNVDLPKISEMIKASEYLFEPIIMRNDPNDYILTLKHWIHNLKKDRKKAVELVGEQVVSQFEKYFRISLISYYTGKVNLTRIIYRRIENPRQ